MGGVLGWRASPQRQRRVSYLNSELHNEAIRYLLAAADEGENGGNELSGKQREAVVICMF